MNRIFTLFLILICHFVNAQKKSSVIIVESFSVTEISKQLLRINIHAKPIGDVSIGSYAISVQGVNNDKEIQQISGLRRINDLFYVVSDDFADDARLLKDNGIVDEDPENNHFAITLNTSKWENGVYDIRVSAMNRPAKGGYVSGNEIYRHTIGSGFDDGNKDLNAVHQVIWSDKNLYAYFPTLSKLDDGSLVTRFATRVNPSHIDTTGGIKTMVSSDLGKSWTIAENNILISDKPNKDGLLVNITGGGWVYEKTENLSRHQSSIIRRVDNSTFAYGSKELFANYSKDSGRTWTKEKIRIPNDIISLFRFSSFRSDDGLRLIGLYGDRERNGIRKNSEIYFLRSVDDGKSWDFVYLTPKWMSDSSLNPTESSIVQTSDGNLLILFRTDRTIFSSVSSDKGRTWSKPKDTGIKGYPPYLLRLSDGRLICFYGYRYNPMGIRACISYDNGKTWDLKNEIVLRQDGLSFHSGNIGYPRAIELESGEIFVIYYFSTNGHNSVIAGTHFKLDH